MNEQFGSKTKTSVSTNRNRSSNYFILRGSVADPDAYPDPDLGGQKWPRKIEKS
jgi:hypothetical protein